MKTTLLFLALAGSLVLPAVTHADTPVTKGQKPVKAAVAQPKKAPQHVVYYIMGAPRTGSNIPMVYRKYDSRIDSASNAAVYGQTDLQHAGGLDVGTELYQLDTAISLHGHR